MGSVVAFTKVLKKQIKDSDSYYLAAKTLMGDPVALAQLVKNMVDGVFSIPDLVFYEKFSVFLQNAYLSDEDLNEMRIWLDANGENGDEGLQILNYVNNAKSLKKVHYLANATRCAFQNDFSVQVYFEICHAIDMVSESDLKFLADNIVENYEKTFKQNHHTQKLYSVSLMDFVSGLSSHSSHKFNNFAKLVDMCAISFDDDAKYPNRRRGIEKILSELDSQN